MKDETVVGHRLSDKFVGAGSPRPVLGIRRYTLHRVLVGKIL